MAWLAENWFWVLIGILFVGMHLFGHGGHGEDHRAHDSSGCGHGGDKSTRNAGGDRADSEQPPGHRH